MKKIITIFALTAVLFSLAVSVTAFAAPVENSEAVNDISIPVDNDLVSEGTADDSSKADDNSEESSESAESTDASVEDTESADASTESVETSVETSVENSSAETSADESTESKEETKKGIKFTTDNIETSLKHMGIGLLGVMMVLALIGIVVFALNKIFKA